MLVKQGKLSFPNRNLKNFMIEVILNNPNITELLKTQDICFWDYGINPIFDSQAGIYKSKYFLK